MSYSKPIYLREPTLEDGMAVYRLIENCPPLDTNSSYCNLLQCEHFASTSVAAEMNDEIVGFISGYLLPKHPNTLFIWQVAVNEQARGRGLASQMLLHILNRPFCQDVHYIETTITEDNKPSWHLFKALSKSLETQLQHAPWMDKQTHFDSQHDSENLVRIGPFNLNQTNKLL